jgi:prevent-host-death family protein
LEQKMTDKHMSVAEVKRNFSDVLGQVMFGEQRIIVEKRGRPVVAIVPLGEASESARPGKQLAAAIGCGKEAGESFRALMHGVVAERGKRLPRRVKGRVR